MKTNTALSCSSLALGISLMMSCGVCSAQWSSRGPEPRVGSTAVLDTEHNKMIVFGGYTYTPDSPPAAHFNDVWYLNSATSTSPSATWELVTPKGTPPSPRGGHTAVYDSTHNRMIIFGGFGGFANPTLNDVWVLKNADGSSGTPTWEQLHPSGTLPGIRFFHVAVYNPTANRMVIFGGDNGEGVDYNDVWVLENANGLGGTPTWVQFIANGVSSISPRELSSAVYDVTHNRMVVFGGIDAGNGSTLLNDTWVLFDADDTPSTLCNGVGCWSGPLNTGGNPVPSPREGQSAFYDPESNTMHIFGGFNGSNILNENWVLTEANALSGGWEQVTPAGTAPLPRFIHTSVYDATDHRMIIFGGEIATNGLATDTVDILSDANAQ